jgi:predicted transcriptional regulator
MKVLLSIKPEYAIKIFNGTKGYEYRKSIFRNDNVDRIVIYATKPIGKVIGEFEIENIIKDSPRNIWKKTKEKSGISWTFFSQYFVGKKTAFAIKVRNPIMYETPIDIDKVSNSCMPPQSYQYL